MAHIEDRWEKSVNGERVRTERFGQGNRWRARYLDPQGRERSRTFPRKIDATRFLTTVESDKMRGVYVDPAAGRVTLDTYFDEWSRRQLWETGTRQAMSLAVRCTGLGGTPVAKVRRSHIETWIKRMSADGLAPGTIKTRVNNVRAVLRAAVRDQVIAADPGADVALPRDRRREAAMVLPTAYQVAAIINAAKPWFKTFVALAAFAGLRLGEGAGLGSPTSIFSPGRWTFAARCSARTQARSRSALRSTAVSAPSSSLTGSSKCSRSTSPPTARVRIPNGGCSKGLRASLRTRTPLVISGAVLVVEPM